MKKVILIVVALFATTFAFGQRLEVGEIQLNAGLGLNSGDWSTPVYAGVDYGVMPDITVGGFLSYASHDFKYVSGNYKGRWFSIAAKGDYHFNTLLSIPNEWDLYAGLTLAYNNFSYDWDDYHGDYDDSGLGLGIQIGGRYYFTENWAVNLELGGSDIASGGKIGVTYKF